MIFLAITLIGMIAFLIIVIWLALANNTTS
jgi:hypothetical protein